MSDNRMQCLRGICALLLGSALAPAAVLADNTIVYKWKDREGGTVYSQTPPAPDEAARAERLVVGSVPLAQQRAAERELERLKRAADHDRERVRRLEAEERIDAAIRMLEAAQSDLRLGAAPLPGERIANFGGQPAVREDYLVRMSALQARVELARQALDEAYAVRRSM